MSGEAYARLEVSVREAIFMHEYEALVDLASDCFGLYFGHRPCHMMR